MTDWYSIAELDEPLMQGEIVASLPLVVWTPNAATEFDEETLRASVTAIRSDVVVMTQACDLVQDKVDRAVVSVALPIEEFHKQWREIQIAYGKPTGKEAFKKEQEHIRNGYRWNLHLLNEGTVGEYATPFRVVDFHHTHTVPIDFLMRRISTSRSPRFRLEPPYREHLSQSFARFFMRVGLPTDIRDLWDPPAQR